MTGTQSGQHSGLAARTTELAEALERGQLTLLYQPIFDIRKSEPVPVLAEALVRWDHPQRGVLTPAEFLGVAAGGGMMGQVTDFVFAAVIERLRYWQAQGSGSRIAVNVAGHLLEEPEFPARLLEMVTRSGIAPDRLVLELNEQGAMLRTPESTGIISQLIQAGFPLFIDDFGKGSISLVRLMRLPFLALKIDEELVSQISHDERAKRLVRGIVHMAHDLGMLVCGEGVETRETLFLLKGLGCDMAQGWLLGTAVPPDLLPAQAEALAEDGV